MNDAIYTFLILLLVAPSAIVLAALMAKGVRRRWCPRVCS